MKIKEILLKGITSLKEYNIEETKIVDVYESYIVGIDKGRIMKLTKDNLERVFG